MVTEIAIIGAGPGGYAAAVRAARMGASVTLIEADNLGGTCLNWGCIPSKVMKTAAELLDQFRRADEFGIRTTGEARPDIKGIVKRKDEVISIQTKGLETLLARRNIRYLKGMGRISEERRIHVAQADNGGVDVAWDRLILATGTRPMELPVLPFDGGKILSTDHILNLSEIPESILIVGGGVIGCEFAFIMASLGSRVTVVEALPRLPFRFLRSTRTAPKSSSGR